VQRRKAAYAYGGGIRFSFLECHRVTRLAAGGMLSGGRYHDVTRAIAVVGSIRIGCLR